MTVEIYVPVLTVLTIDTGAIQSLNNVRLAIGVVSPRRLKFLLLGRELANDLVNCYPRGLLRDYRAFAALRVSRQYAHQSSE